MFTKNIKYLRNILIAVAAALIVGLGGQLWRSYANLEQTLTVGFRITELRGLIIYLDEALTMSTRMAVATGDLAWEERYQSFVGELDGAITELKIVAPRAFSEFAERTDNANKVLLEMESQAFDLLKQGQHEEATAVLSSAEYETQKIRYAAGMSTLSILLLAERESFLKSQFRTVLVGLAQVLLASLVLVALWVGYSLALKRQDALNIDLARGKRVQKKLLGAMTTDFLTSLHNRRYGLVRLQREIDRARRYQTPLSVLMVDLDYFKRVNDEHGHLCGDEILRSFSRTLVDSCRTVDIVARYGGEEFIAILPNTKVEEATLLANRICHDTRIKEFHCEETPVAVTCSIGVAVYTSETFDAEALLGSADIALYESKSSGRDRVSVA